MTTSADIPSHDPPKPAPSGVAPLILAGLAAWFAAVWAVGATGAFVSTPAQPPLAILVAIAGPPLAFAIAYGALPRVRDFALAIDLRWLTAVQAWRVAGVMFLVLYAFGLLPALFAWPAGAGDVAVGLAAPFVVSAMLRRAPDWPRRVLWLNIAGLLDFVGAIGTGVLTSESAIGIFFESSSHASMGALPLSLVPTFAVPLWIIFHMISLLQLRHLARTGQEG